MRRFRSKPVFADGWKMSIGQRNSYFKMWAQIVRVRGYRGSAEVMSALRHDFHAECGLGRISAKEIDRMKGFDAVKARFLAIMHPANLNAQMSMADQPRHRLITRITDMAPQAYWARIARDKYGTDDLDGLNEKELTDLRNTLEARTAKLKTTVECPF